MILNRPIFYRFLVAVLAKIHSSLEKVRDAHQDAVRANNVRITNLQIDNLNLERESFRAERLASRLRPVLED